MLFGLVDQEAGAQEFRTTHAAPESFEAGQRTLQRLRCRPDLDRARHAQLMELLERRYVG
jgi:hypothetical protein